MADKMKCIFVVDDSSINLLTAKEALSEHYIVMTLSSAMIMFEFLNNIKPDLILLDIEMPDMNGFEALKQLKTDNRYAGIPVMFVTGNNDSATESLGYEMGAIDFITKPFSKSALLDRVKDFFKEDRK